MSDGRTQSHLLPRECDERAAAAEARTRPDGRARASRPPRSDCVRFSVPLRLALARWIVDSDPFLDAVFRMNRRAGEDAFRPLLASVLGVRPPQARLNPPGVMAPGPNTKSLSGRTDKITRAF